MKKFAIKTVRKNDQMTALGTNKAGPLKTVHYLADEDTTHLVRSKLLSEMGLPSKLFKRK